MVMYHILLSNVYVYTFEVCPTNLFFFFTKAFIYLVMMCILLCRNCVHAKARNLLSVKYATDFVTSVYSSYVL